MSETAKTDGSRNIHEIVKAARQEAIRKQLHRFLRRLCTVVVIVGFVNFILFLAGAFYFGGDAVSGRTESGKYYLWGYHNGTKGYTEVSRAVFVYSKWHAYSMMVTWSLMIVAGFAMKRLGRHLDD